MKLKVAYLPSYDISWGVLQYAHPTDAGIDLRSTVDMLIMPGGYVKIPLGIVTEFEPGYEAQLRARSGLAAKHGIGLVNGIGTIDAGYRGEWAVLLINHGAEPFEINRGDRVCQVVFNRLPWVEFIDGPITFDNDRAGGFGSTGVF